MLTIPRLVKALGRRIKWLIYGLPLGKHCKVCGRGVFKFLPLPGFYAENMQKYGFPYSLDAYETQNNKAFNCPHCFSSDRDRLYALFLEGWLKTRKTPHKLECLEIAPAKALSRWVKQTGRLNLRTCDLMMPGVDDVADIHNLPYKDASYDVVICSHVLEHVTGPLQAVKEIRRILKPQGIAILMVPIVKGLKATHEDASVTTPEGRWKHFGQDDHLRLFAKNDFMDLIRKSGLKLEAVPMKTLMAPRECARYGITEGSVLYVGVKTAETAKTRKK